MLWGFEIGSSLETIESNSDKQTFVKCLLVFPSNEYKTIEYYRTKKKRSNVDETED